MKHALVQSGGGPLGAWQVGACRALAELGRHPNLFCGTSVGAINSAFLAMFPDFMPAVNELFELWYDLETEAIHRRWPFGWLQGWFKGSLRDSRPLAEMVERLFDRAKVLETANALRIPAVCYDDLRYRVWTEQDEDVGQAVVASAAFPVMLTPVLLRGRWYGDAGMRHMTPLKAAFEAGADSIDVLVATRPAEGDQGAWRHLGDVGLRALGAALDTILVSDVRRAETYNDLLALLEILEINQIPTPALQTEISGKRRVPLRVYWPSTPLDSGGLLEWDPPRIHAMLAQGFDDVMRCEHG